MSGSHQQRNYAKAKNLQQKGQALAQRADYLNVCAVLKVRPDLVHEYKRRLIEMDIFGADGTPRSELLEKFKKDQESINPLAVKSEDGGSASTDDTSLEAMGSIEVHRNFATFGDIPPRHYRYLLWRLEPIAFGRFGIKALIRKGGKEPSKNVVCELREYLTDIANDEPIGRDRTLAKIGDRLCEKNAKCGRRGRDLELADPMDWSSAGLFAVIKRLPDLQISLKSTERTISVSLVDLLRDSGLHTQPDKVDVTIAQNYSMSRACIMLDGERAECDSIEKLFMQGGSELQSPAKQGAVVSRSIDLDAEAKQNNPQFWSPRRRARSRDTSLTTPPSSSKKIKKEITRTDEGLLSTIETTADTTGHTDDAGGLATHALGTATPTQAETASEGDPFEALTGVKVEDTPEAKEEPPDAGDTAAAEVAFVPEIPAEDSQLPEPPPDVD